MSYYNNSTILYLDGEFLKAADASGDLYSQSLHYGYAVYEGIRSYTSAEGEARIWRAEAHFERLKASAEAIGIPFPYEVAELVKASYKVLEMNNMTDAYIRPLVFCPPNMGLTYAQTSRILIAVWEWGAYLGEKQLNVMLSSFQRPNPSAFRIHAKVSGHYVNSIMASQEAKNKGFDEALLTDKNGNVAEGPGANIFFEKDGSLVTPPTDYVVEGITRASVLEICSDWDIAVSERFFTPEELAQADSAFFCGTAAEIIGWHSFNGQSFPMSWTNSLGKRIRDEYLKRVKA
ncbi:MAG: branched-chain-amino-acid transaminase [Bacteroidota bacterium]